MIRNGLIISRSVATLRQERAILTGGLLGCGLYLINWGVVALGWPQWHNNPAGVLLTHVVFGVIAAGAYRALLRRTTALEGHEQPS
jgi:hypothetical protein